MALNGGGDIRAALASGGTVTGRISPGATLTATLSSALPVSGVYEGPYTVVPARTAQTLHTAGTIAARDIIVEAIPQNYGLITWNGAVLTVS